MQICGVIIHELSALNRTVVNSCGKAFSRRAFVKLQGVSKFERAPIDYAGFSRIHRVCGKNFDGTARLVEILRVAFTGNAINFSILTPLGRIKSLLL